MRSIKGSIYSYNGSVGQYNDKGYGKLPGNAHYKAEGYYDLAWSSRAVVVVGAGV